MNNCTSVTLLTRLGLPESHWPNQSEFDYCCQIPWCQWSYWWGKATLKGNEGISQLICLLGMWKLGEQQQQAEILKSRFVWLNTYLGIAKYRKIGNKYINPIKTGLMEMILHMKAEAQQWKNIYSNRKSITIYVLLLIQSYFMLSPS